nr:PREDICTED: zinc finger protein 768-like isoform X2 [Bemisia tabaci]
MRPLRFVNPRYAVFILRLWFLLRHYGEAMQSADWSWTTAIQAVHDAANRCSQVTGGSPAEMRQAAHLTCKQVPPCVLEEAFGARAKILTVDTCASELFNMDPTRRNPPPPLSRGASSSSSRDRSKRPLEGTSQRQDTGGAGRWSSANPFQPGGTGGWGSANPLQPGETGGWGSADPFQPGGAGAWSSVNPFETGGTAGWSSVNLFETGGTGGWSSAAPYPGGYYQPSGSSYLTRPSPPRSPPRAANPPPRVYPSVRVPPSGGTAPSAARVLPSVKVPPSFGTSNIDQFTGFSFGDSLPGSPRRTPPPPSGLPVDPSFGVSAYGFGSDDELEHGGRTSNPPPFPGGSSLRGMRGQTPPPLSPELPVDSSFGVSAYGFGSDDELEHEGGTSNPPLPPASPSRPRGSRSKRKNIGDFICPVCEKAYTYKKQFERHTATHDGIGGKYTCPKCENPTSFLTKKKYNEHMESEHGAVFFECDEDDCGRTFQNAMQLRLHKDRDHFGGMTCQICQAVLPSRQMLQTHMKTHARDGSRNAP